MLIIHATGSTLNEIKANMREAIEDYIGTCTETGCEIPELVRGRYDFEFTMDVKSLLSFYSGIFTKAGLERLTGINQKQLWHYASGKTVPRRAQVQKIENALHQLGNELLSIHL